MKILLIAIFICTVLTVQAAKTKPSDPKATPETVKLYQNMLKLKEKGMMY
ncbi:MAG: hypothetical protein Q7J86_15680 [Bacteroidota bacterium]|nr:hypothetical protein [Bacteroidota bacterium]